ncbi:MAG: hypothetical protein JXR83_06015 [Deltaproteobacteria bacterium]|nr:hypothetical protein [Deltaproteobacteria bacterium]
MITKRQIARSLWLPVLVLGCDNPIFHELPSTKSPNVTCTPPLAPTGLQVQVDAEKIVLSWTAKTDDNVEYGGFVVEQRTFLQPTWGTLVEIHDGAARSHEIAQPLLDTQYSFRVRGFGSDATCVSLPTDEYVVTTLPRPAENPDAIAFANRVVLQWRDPNDFETSYVVERRRLGFEREFHEIANLVRNSEEYVDEIPASDLEAIVRGNLDRTYQYYVFAVNSAGRSQAELISQPLQLIARLPVPPIVDWADAPYLAYDAYERTCTLTIPATAIFDTDVGACYDPQRSSATVAGDSAAVTALGTPPDRYDITWPLAGAPAGTVETSWDVVDTLDGSAHIDRTLGFFSSRVTRSRMRLPTPALGDDDGPGRQILLPGCATCSGSRGSLAASRTHTCVLTVDGGVKCWGDNSYGALGNGVLWRSSYPVEVCSGAIDAPCSTGLRDVDVLALGDGVSCALMDDDTVECWGDGTYGKLGIGTTGGLENIAHPQNVCASGQASNQSCVELAGVGSLGVGSDHACAVLADGSVQCWGDNGSGQLGTGVGDEAANPTPVCGNDLTGSCSAQLGEVAQVVSGTAFTCALTTSGQVKCWGANSYGQIGQGTDVGVPLPTRVCLTGSDIGGNCTPLATVTALAAGSSHVCALLQSGHAMCWGNNWSGQLGDGTDDKRSRPVEVCATGSADTGDCVPLANIAAIACGDEHTCAVVAGQIYCWGDGYYGKLGTGTTDDQLHPTPVCTSGSWDGTACVDAAGAVTGYLTGARAIAAGADHTCAIMSDGQARCWGYNYQGRLGDGTTTQRPTPVAVCDTGSGTTCVPLTGVVALGLGENYTCALLDDTSVKCWGSNYYGQLGNGGDGSSQYNPVLVCASGYGTGCVALADVTALTVGSYYACARLASGGAVCWGDNGDYEFGDGTTYSSDWPTDVCATGTAGVDCAPFSGVASIEAGFSHTCAVTDGQALLCWGNNDNSRLGIGVVDNSGNPVDVCVAGGGVQCVPYANAIAVVAGEEHTCALIQSGLTTAVQCWGENYNYELGDGTWDDRNRPGDVCASGAWDGTTCAGGSALVDVVAIAAGMAHTCALLVDSSVVCWGQNGSGQLGNPDWSYPYDPSNPVSVCDGDGDTCAAVLIGVDEVRAGEYHTCALMLDGAVKCWGNNYYGRLGDGTTEQRLGAVDVCAVGSSDDSSCQPLQGATAIAVGDAFTCAIVAGGLVQCWGYNTSGQLGDGTVLERHNPVDVCRSGTSADGDCVPLTGASAIAAGSTHVCALVDDGGVEKTFCWGSNDEGELGSGLAGIMPRPVDVCASGVGTTCQRLTGVAAIAAGDLHTCALLNDGAVKCWGDRYKGELGDGLAGSTAGRSPNPTDVCVTGNSSDGDCVPLTGAVAIASRLYNTCALMADGTARCWGDNQYAQTGSGIIGTTADGVTEPNPVTVCESGRGAGCTPQAGLVSITVGSFHSCAVTVDGQVKCWGDNYYRQLGDGTDDGEGCVESDGSWTPCRPRPVDVCSTGWGPGCEPLTGVVSVSAGYGFTCALTDRGTVLCWGDNDYGQLGDGTLYGATTPQLVCLSGSGNQCPALTDVVGVVATNVTACAVDRAGAVWCWGSNDVGELGNGVRDYYAVGYPAKVCASGNYACDGQCAGELSDVVALNGGSWSACALTASGAVRCWGSNYRGNLGNGLYDSSEYHSGTYSVTCGPVDVCQSGSGIGCGGGQPLSGSAVRGCDLLQVAVQ